jgi:RalA-binding protein 1
VSELEKKIDALTASLQARAAPAAHQSPQSHTQQQQQQHQHQYGSPDVVSSGSGSGAAAAAHNDRARQHSGTMQGNEHRRWNKEIAPWDRRSGPADNDSPFQQLITIAGKKRKAGDDGQEQQQQQQQQQNQHQGRVEAQDERAPSTTAAAMGWPAYTSKAADGDVVDRGLVPKEMALELFAKYKAQMVRHLPGIVFPPSTTVAELRKTKPILFLSIMAAASGENHSLQRVLQKELMQIFAEKVIVTGEKSLELVQALTVAVIWYWPPEYFEELKFYQLIHIAAVMALDIGLGRKSPSRGGRGSMGWRENPSRRNPPPDPLSLESRRTWLTCYYLAANTSISLHRPNLIRWTPFMAESMEILETSPDAAPTDKYFCHLVWTHHLGEQISNQFSMDDPSAAVNIADPRTQYALRAFERDLERYIASVPQERMQGEFN